MHRFQISVFGAIAIVFAVTGVNEGIFSGEAALDAMAAGWLILAIVDVLWVLYFTSEEDSLALHLFNALGTGGLTPPSRRRRTRTGNSVHMGGNGNGYTNSYAPDNYASGGGIGSHEPYDAKMSGIGSAGAGGVRSQNSFGAGSQNEDMNNRSMGAGTGGLGSNQNSPAGGGTASLGGADTTGPHSPLMAGIGAGGLGSATASEPAVPLDAYLYKAKALYACKRAITFYTTREF